MAIQRTLTNALFLATLAVSAGYAAFSPTEAQAEKPYDCAGGVKKKSGWRNGDFTKLCNEAGVKTDKNMKDLMKKWTKDKKVDGKEMTCKTCHKDANGSEIATDDAYGWLDKLMPKPAK